MIEAAHFAAGGDRPHVAPAQAASEASSASSAASTRSSPLHAAQRAVRAAGRARRRHVPSRASPTSRCRSSRSRDRRPGGYPAASRAPPTTGRRIRRLEQVGCVVESSGTEPARRRCRGIAASSGHRRRLLVVTPPSWRPDLTDPNDLAEEVIRLEGYDEPALDPARRPAGPRADASASGCAAGSAAALAAAGYVEVLSYPFVGERDFDALRPAPPTTRAAAPSRLANPLSDEEPLTAHHAAARPARDAAPQRRPRLRRPGAVRDGPGLPAHGRTRPPSRRVLARRPPADATRSSPRWTPRCRTSRCRSRSCWPASASRPAGGAPGRPAGWADAVEAARAVAARGRGRAGRPRGPARALAPGPLRRAVRRGRRLVGHAGELHPRVVEALGLPPRTCAMELDLDLLEPPTARPAAGPGDLRLSRWPPRTSRWSSTRRCRGRRVEAALREGAGALLESVRLFDVYTGEQVGEGRKSLAYALRFRAADRTLTAEEATAARDAAVALAAERTGAAAARRLTGVRGARGHIPSPFRRSGPGFPPVRNLRSARGPAPGGSSLREGRWVPAGRSGWPARSA